MADDIVNIIDQLDACSDCRRKDAEIERLQEAVKDLAAKVYFMIDFSCLWGDEERFSFPDGEVWEKGRTRREQ